MLHPSASAEAADGSFHKNVGRIPSILLFFRPIRCTNCGFADGWSKPHPYGVDVAFSDQPTTRSTQRVGGLRKPPYDGLPRQTPIFRCAGLEYANCEKHQKNAVPAFRLFTEGGRKKFQIPVAISIKIGYNTPAWALSLRNSKTTHPGIAPPCVLSFRAGCAG